MFTYQVPWCPSTLRNRYKYCIVICSCPLCQHKQLVRTVRKFPARSNIVPAQVDAQLCKLRHACQAGRHVNDMHRSVGPRVSLPLGQQTSTATFELWPFIMAVVIRCFLLPCLRFSREDRGQRQSACRPKRTPSRGGRRTREVRLLLHFFQWRCCFCVDGPVSLVMRFRRWGCCSQTTFFVNLSKIEIRNDQSSRREQPMILVQLTSFRSRREWTMALAAVAVSSLQSLV